LHLRVRTRDEGNARTDANIMGHHNGDERGQGAHVSADTTGDVSHVAMLQADVDLPVLQARRNHPVGRDRTAEIVRVELGHVAKSDDFRRVVHILDVSRLYVFRVFRPVRVRDDRHLHHVVSAANLVVHVPDRVGLSGRPERQ